MLKSTAAALTVAGLLIATIALAQQEDFGWALVSRGSTVATSADELSRLDGRTTDSDRVLYARFDQAEYLIRDPETLDRVDDLVEPIRRLGQKAREIRASGGSERGDKLGKREWKERLRPFKEKRRELLLRVSPRIEALARDAVSSGKAQRLD